LRLIQDMTPEGLLLEDVSGQGAVEWDIANTGLRLGIGGGVGYLFLHRATNGSFVEIPGLDAFARFGYDSGVHNRPFAVVDLEVRLPLGAVTWAPTVQVGWRF
jgi:hypothetical protein